MSRKEQLTPPPDLDDVEALAIHADALSEQGDPHGELILLQLGGVEGELEASVRRPIERSIAADASFQWRNGFVTRLDSFLATADLSHPALRHLKALEVSMPFEVTPLPHLESLSIHAEAPQPASVYNAIYASAPHLRELSVESDEGFETIGDPSALEGLRRLDIRAGEDSSAIVPTVLELAGLERLCFGGDTVPTLRSLAPLLEGTSLPALTEFGLFGEGLLDDLLPAVLASPLCRRLRAVGFEFEGYTTSEVAAEFRRFRTTWPDDLNLLLDPIFDEDEEIAPQLFIHAVVFGRAFGQAAKARELLARARALSSSPEIELELNLVDNNYVETPTSQLRRAELDFVSERYIDARDTALGLVSGGAEADRALFLVARVDAILGDHTAAAERFAALVGRAPTDFAAADHHIVCLAQLQRYDDVVQASDAALVRFGPRHPSISCHAAVAFATLGRIEDAYLRLRSARAALGDADEIVEVEAALDVSLKPVAELARGYRELAARQPRHDAVSAFQSSAPFDLGREAFALILIRRGDFEAAAALLTDRTSNERDFPAAVALALCYIELGHTEFATPLLSRFLQSQCVAHRGLAIALTNLGTPGRFEEMRHDFPSRFDGCDDHPQAGWDLDRLELRIAHALLPSELGVPPCEGTATTVPLPVRIYTRALLEGCASLVKDPSELNNIAAALFP